MKTTNKELINILLGAGIKPNLLVNNFAIVGKLIKKHGRTLFTQKYIEEISNADQNVGNLISILKSTNKVSYQDTKDFIKITKTLADNYNDEFTIVSDSKDHNDKLESHLNKQFQKTKINTQLSGDTKESSQEHIGVSISGEGRYFKKDLDTDLEKILG